MVISKSGGTAETRNGMLEAAARFRRPGSTLRSNAVAVTGDGSELDKVATSQGWLARFPMWDWVGGRTSVMSAVGLVPLWLQGLDMQSLLDGRGGDGRVDAHHGDAEKSRACCSR